MTFARRASAVGAVAAVVALTLAACSTATEPEPDTADRTTATAEAFLDTYVDAGRVVRTDQGGDTVSEGQAYGLLLAVAADDPSRFDSIWEWTTTHLQRDDGLLAWQWKDGAVVDEQPASDADLDAARALVLAGDAFGRDDLRDQGVALGAAVLDEMTTRDRDRPHPAPGAVGDGIPHAYNPSYASPAAFDVLARASGDSRWEELAAGSAAVTSALMDANTLPTNWATVADDGTVALAGPRAAGASRPTGTTPRARRSGSPSRAGTTTARSPRAWRRCSPATTNCPPSSTRGRAPSRRTGTRSRTPRGRPPSGRAGATTRRGPICSAWPTPRHPPHVLRCGLDGPGDGDAHRRRARRLPRARGRPAAADRRCDGRRGDDGAGRRRGGRLPESGDPRGGQHGPARAHLDPAIGVDSDLIGLDRGADGWIQSPQDYDAVGWYEKGVLPGEVGPAVIAGHVDSPRGRRCSTTCRG